jgi:hypothetical protein
MQNDDKMRAAVGDVDTLRSMLNCTRSFVPSQTLH